MFQAPKRSRVNNTVAVTLERGSACQCLMFLFVQQPATTCRSMTRIGRKAAMFCLVSQFAWPLNDLGVDLNFTTGLNVGSDNQNRNHNTTHRQILVSAVWFSLIWNCSDAISLLNIIGSEQLSTTG